MMIYRALECANVYAAGSPQTAWFQAPSDLEAQKKLPLLLAQAWDVAPEEVFFGKISSVVDLARDSVEPDAAGDRRWFETGNRGAHPRYTCGLDLVALNSHNLARLRGALDAAQRHAMDLADGLELDARKAIGASRGWAEDDARALRRFAEGQFYA